MELATPPCQRSPMTLLHKWNSKIESQETTLNGNAKHKQLDGYRDCYLAKSVHGTGLISLNGSNFFHCERVAEPKYRWRYHGGIHDIAPDVGVANISLPTGFTDMNSRRKDKLPCYAMSARGQSNKIYRWCLEPGNLPQIMLAVDQNERV